MTAVPGYPGWDLGNPVVDYGITRAAVTYHTGTCGIWVRGNTPYQRIRMAQMAIDEFYCHRRFDLVEHLYSEGAGVTIA